MLTLAGVDRGQTPDKLTYKQTYRIKGPPHACPLFSQFSGQFGIAGVIGYYDCGTGDPHGSTRRFLNGAEFWRVFGQGFRGGRPEERGLQCIALSGDGKALLDLDVTDGGTPSPYELLETILHAIIGKWLNHSVPRLLLTFSNLGHYNLFDNGVLHRDISSGNIMRYSVPIERPTLNKYGPSFRAFIDLILINPLGLSALEM